MGGINAIFDAHGKLYYVPESQRLRLFDKDGQIRLTVPIHRVHQPKSRRFPKGNQYNIQLTHQTRDGADIDCELQFKSPDDAARLNLHEFILDERGIEHPGANRQKYPPGNHKPVKQTPEPKRTPPLKTIDSANNAYVPRLVDTDICQRFRQSWQKADADRGSLQQLNGHKRSSTYRDTDCVQVLDGKNYEVLDGKKYEVLDGMNHDTSPELGLNGNGEPRPSTSSYRRTGQSQSLLNGNASSQRRVTTSQSTLNGNASFLRRPTTSQSTLNGDASSLRRGTGSQSTLNGDALSDNSRLSFVTQRRRVTRNAVQLPCGLRNLGNTCYANATLQALMFSAREFCDKLVEYVKLLLRKVKEAESNGDLVFEALPFTTAFVKIFYNGHYKNVDGTNRLREELEKFLAQLRLRAPNFVEGKQHDAHEFLVVWMDQLETELKNNVHDLLGMEPMKPDLVSQYFHWTLQRSYVCPECEHEEKKDEEGTHFLPHIEATETEESEMESTANILRRAIVETDPKSCAGCGSQVHGVAQGFRQLPTLLIVCTKRYAYDVEANLKRKLKNHIALSKFIAVADCEHQAATAAARNGSPRRKSRRRAGAAAAASNTTTSSTDLEMEEVQPVQDKGHLYNPVGQEWREKWCREWECEEELVDAADNAYEVYNLSVDQPEFRYTTHQEPAHVEEVLGDGNCLFRALSHLVTGGSEELHEKLRQMICEYMAKHAKWFAKMEGKDEADFLAYVEEMREDTTWGTAVEISAFATMTQTPVATFHEGRWVVYKPRFTLVDGEEKECAR
ncbi:DUO-3 protein [Aphelenchoides avenae]|nr:DUO-3 protein [Aphelenchus avenae]